MYQISKHNVESTMIVCVCVILNTAQYEIQVNLKSQSSGLYGRNEYLHKIFMILQESCSTIFNLSVSKENISGKNIYLTVQGGVLKGFILVSYINLWVYGQIESEFQMRHKGW
jgi:hypothetical protein